MPAQHTSLSGITHAVRRLLEHTDEVVTLCGQRFTASKRGDHRRFCNNPECSARWNSAPPAPPFISG